MKVKGVVQQMGDTAAICSSYSPDNNPSISWVTVHIELENPPTAYPIVLNNQMSMPRPAKSIPNSTIFQFTLAADSNSFNPTHYPLTTSHLMPLRKGKDALSQGTHLSFAFLKIGIPLS